MRVRTLDTETRVRILRVATHLEVGESATIPPKLGSFEAVRRLINRAGTTHGMHFSVDDGPSGYVVRRLGAPPAKDPRKGIPWFSAKLLQMEVGASAEIDGDTLTISSAAAFLRRTTKTLDFEIKIVRPGMARVTRLPDRSGSLRPGPRPAFEVRELEEGEIAAVECLPGDEGRLRAYIHKRAQRSGHSFRCERVRGTTTVTVERLPDGSRRRGPDTRIVDALQHMEPGAALRVDADEFAVLAAIRQVRAVSRRVAFSHEVLARGGCMVTAHDPAAIDGRRLRNKYGFRPLEIGESATLNADLRDHQSLRAAAHNYAARLGQRWRCNKLDATTFRVTREA